MAENYENEKYAYLNRLSTEQLEELLRADIESSDTGNEDVIFHILEVIEKREKEHPTGRLPDEDKAWEEFQKYYNTPENEVVSLYPTGDEEGTECAAPTRKSKIIRLRPVLKVAGIAAAVVVGIFAVMIGAQARGIDVFGAIGRWTEETFHFVTSPSGAVQSKESSRTMESNYYVALKAALSNSKIREEIAPSWFLNGFETDGPEVLSDDFSDTVYCGFTNADGTFFNIQISKYKSVSDMESITFEKDVAHVTEHTSGGRTFYFLSNDDTTTATWSDAQSLVMSIWGNISEDNIKEIINSIGG